MRRCCPRYRTLFGDNQGENPACWARSRGQVERGPRRVSVGRMIGKGASGVPKGVRNEDRVRQPCVEVERWACAPMKPAASGCQALASPRRKKSVPERRALPVCTHVDEGPSDTHGHSLVTFWSQSDRTGSDKRRKSLNYLERETGFEPATSTLARLRSTS